MAFQPVSLCCRCRMDRRQFFRSPIVDRTDAILKVGRSSLQVDVRNESCGGFHVVATTSIKAVGDFGSLHFDDGRTIRVLVKRCEAQGPDHGIGLERLDLTSRGDAAHEANVTPRLYAVVLTMGLAIGCIVQNGPMQERLLKWLGYGSPAHTALIR